MKTIGIVATALSLLSPSLARGPPDIQGKGEMPFGPFPNHCYNYKLSKSYNAHGKNFWLVIAECEVAGAMERLSINLNDCIANLSGEMRWQLAGGFGESCSNCIHDMAQSTILNCNCEGKGPDGANGGVSSIDLAPRIGWDEGRLKCWVPSQNSD